MQLLITLLLIWVLGISATPTHENSEAHIDQVIPGYTIRQGGETFTVVRTEIHHGGTLSYWTDNPGMTNDADSFLELKRDRPALRRRCGSNDPRKCDNSNKAPWKTCSRLATILSQGGKFYVEETVRAVCFSYNQDMCCASWNKYTKGVYHDMIVPAIKEGLKCDPNEKDVSARVYDVQLGERCLMQCLSNRPTFC